MVGMTLATNASLFCSRYKQNSTHSSRQTLLDAKPRIHFLNVSTIAQLTSLKMHPGLFHHRNPSYLLIKSSNHGLDPFHWFVSRHGRAERHRSVCVAKSTYGDGSVKLENAWKSVLNRWERTKGASICLFLYNSPCHRH